MRRRRAFSRAGLGLVVTVLMITTATGPAGGVEPEDHQTTIRALTGAAFTTGGMLNELVQEFGEEAGYTVQLQTAGPDIFDRARAGEADVVFTHLGFVELEKFVKAGHGEWPTLILSNSVAFIGPPGDPADIRGATDPVEAFKRIASIGSPFVVNELGEVTHIVDTLWNQAGRPDKAGWYLDLGLSGPPAVRAAEQRGGYTMWGLHPFLTLQGSPNPVKMEPSLFADSLMQRIMASVVVKSTYGTPANVKGARALERFLADPAVQAQIRSFRMPGVEGQIFWQAANNNDNR